MIGQLISGSIVLCVCTFLHLIIIVYWVRFLRTYRTPQTDPAGVAPLFLMIGSTLVMIILAHTIQVWIWATSLLVLNALGNLSDAIYYALITYTTVGYGDITLDPEFRIFGAMASTTGLLGFGISTALLVEVLGKLLPRHQN